MWWVLLLIVSFTGCASVPMAPPALDAQAKHFRPPTDAGQLYVVRDGYLGTAVLFQVFLDGHLIGLLPPRSYLLATVPPGNHLATSITTENQASLPFLALAGMNTFIRLEARLGWLSPRVALEAMAEGDGRNAVLATERIQPFP